MPNDPRLNFATSSVVSIVSSTKITISSGHWKRFPTTFPFNAIISPEQEEATSENAEIVRVTGINTSTDTVTFTRKQEGTVERTIAVGDRFYAGPTDKTFKDLEGSIGVAAGSLPLNHAPENCLGASIADRSLVSSETVAALTSARMYGIRIQVLPGSTITNVNVLAGTTEGVALTHSWTALYDTSWNKIVVSTDNTGATWGKKVIRTFALETPYSVPTGVVAIYCFVCVVGTTVPSLAGAPNMAPSVESILPLVAVSGNTGLTTPSTAPAIAEHSVVQKNLAYIWLT